ncbi:GlsB/YeaQ/YmgE family stress response membrane protein [uncultured Kushneria sp.]|uniref:GlsB/YeaQ/YmgE family stress response membrane protein n=1 Tax=uncultured Kushneria sp. TaxID=905033 RepID=UPI002633E66D|nr:GlsB/YeaQ/YmgE family stress response membrane protein [uncultured Kushneria sp.]
MNIISWIFASIAVGMLVNLIIPRRLSVGFLGTAGMGVLGGVVLGFIVTVFGFAAELEFDVRSLAAAVVGALGGIAVMTIWMVRYNKG